MELGVSFPGFVTNIQKELTYKKKAVQDKNRATVDYFRISVTLIIVHASTLIHKPLVRAVSHHHRHDAGGYTDT